MALGDDYATLTQLADRMGLNDSTDDARLVGALATVSRGIETVCGRQFNDAGEVSARRFYPGTSDVANIHDFSTDQGLLVATDTADNGTYATTWDAADYQLEPLDGIVSQVPGWAYWTIRAVGSRCFPCRARRAPLQVTARWGWAAVPAPVEEACLIVSSETVKLRDAPFGVAGYDGWGAIRVRQNPVAMGMLRAYMRDPVLVG